MITFDPYTMKNGVNWVEQLTIICGLHKDYGSSSTQALADHSSGGTKHGFSPWTIRPFTHSTWTIDCECSMEAKCIQVPWDQHLIYTNSAGVNANIHSLAFLWDADWIGDPSEWRLLWWSGCEELRDLPHFLSLGVREMTKCLLDGVL